MEYNLELCWINVYLWLCSLNLFVLIAPLGLISGPLVRDQQRLPHLDAELFPGGLWLNQVSDSEHRRQHKRPHGAALACSDAVRRQIGLTKLLETRYLVHIVTFTVDFSEKMWFQVHPPTVSRVRSLRGGMKQDLCLGPHVVHRRVRVLVNRRPR